MTITIVVPVSFNSAEESHHFGPMSGVKISCWLVGKDEFRLRDDGTRNGNALLLSAGELLRESDSCGG